MTDDAAGASTIEHYDKHKGDERNEQVRGIRTLGGDDGTILDRGNCDGAVAGAAQAQVVGEGEQAFAPAASTTRGGADDLPTNKSDLPTNKSDLPTNADDVDWDEKIGVDLIPDYIVCVWVEVYPSRNHFYKRRRGYRVIGGEKVGNRWRGGKRKRENLKYLGRVYGYESVRRAKRANRRTKAKHLVEKDYVKRK